MSHSKYNKRGHSLYLDNWNPNAKKYINECKMCGYKGYGYAAVVEILSAALSGGKFMKALTGVSEDGKSITIEFIVRPIDKNMDMTNPKKNNKNGFVKKIKNVFGIK